MQCNSRAAMVWFIIIIIICLFLKAILILVFIHNISLPFHPLNNFFV